MHLIISCSLSPNSKSRAMALYAKDIASSNVTYIDLRDYPLPLCTGGPKEETAELLFLTEQIAKAESIILAGPVYNYDLNAAAKNLIEWTGKSWMQKTVGCILAAGGKNSFLSPFSFLNSLMADFRCIIVPRYVYADRSMFQGTIPAPEVQTRIEELVHYTHRLGSAVSKLHAEE